MVMFRFLGDSSIQSFHVFLFSFHDREPREQHLHWREQHLQPSVLPGGGQPDRPLDRNDIRTVEVNQSGGYMLDNESLSLAQIEQKLVADHQNNPNILVYVRGDHRGTYGAVAAVLNRCEQNGITRVSLRTELQNDLTSQVKIFSS